ncbi:SMP-30/gluconolactonase/LRE family protein [Opitutia bacterium ISCC 51]|nr:SMP-30/gluconolactonase/LRE family protein [Opitutae bacterium ISCC 51]QXD27179.1 SMP-30/gluconolactonase/LRE family protein [Opitutae bacterium ISCC 52]
MFSRFAALFALISFPFTNQAATEETVMAAGDNSGLKVEGNVAFTEGPAWHAPSKSVFFTDVLNNRIMRRDASGAVQVYRSPSMHANGLAFDNENRLIACQGGIADSVRGITRTEADGTIVYLTDNYQGNRYNAPNDLAIDSKGRIFFTDPRYGPQAGKEIFDKDGKSIEGVYRIDPDGSVTQILTHEIDRPNGIAISSDEKFLFVADNAGGMPKGNRKLWRFALKKNGDLDTSTQKQLFDWRSSLGIDRGPDGMAVGKDGNLYVTAGWNFNHAPVPEPRKYKAGIYVIDPNGKGLQRFIPIPQDNITNCTFGGEDGNTLFITAGQRLFSIEIE